MATVAMNKSKNSDVQLTPVPTNLKILTIVTVLGLLGTLYLGLVNVGTDVEQGDVQRLFYIHMPAFFGAFTAFGATVFGGIMYLTRRDPKWDRFGPNPPLYPLKNRYRLRDKPAATAGIA